MAAGCKKAYIASGSQSIYAFGEASEHRLVEYPFLAWGDEHAPVVAREVAHENNFTLTKVVRVADAGYVDVPLK